MSATAAMVGTNRRVFTSTNGRNNSQREFDTYNNIVISRCDQVTAELGSTVSITVYR